MSTTLVLDIILIKNWIEGFQYIGKSRYSMIAGEFINQLEIPTHLWWSGLWDPSLPGLGRWDRKDKGSWILIDSRLSWHHPGMRQKRLTPWMQPPRNRLCPLAPKKWRKIHKVGGWDERSCGLHIVFCFYTTRNIRQAQLEIQDRHGERSFQPVPLLLVFSFLGPLSSSSSGKTQK